MNNCDHLKWKEKNVTNKYNYLASPTLLIIKGM